MLLGRAPRCAILGPMPISHVVQPGECIASIAFAHGHFPATIWDAPENEALRQRRGHPNVLEAGDVVIVPDKRSRVATVTTGQRHVFRRKGIPEKLQLQFMLAGEPRDHETYELRVDGMVVATDALTDDEGRIEHYIPPHAERAEVRFLETGDTHVFALGELDPLDTVAGVQGRLESLGYAAGPRGAALDHPQLRSALIHYQVARGLETTGTPDDATVAALRQDYGV
jgi:hypothetical protein